MKLFYTSILTVLISFFALGQNTTRTFDEGSIIIDMSGQTEASVLKAYGLIYKLMNENDALVSWVIKPDKAADEADFTYNGVDYKGGPFVIANEYVTPAILATCASWVSTHTSVNYVVTANGPFTANQFILLNVVPRWAFYDNDKASITKGYLDDAGIPHGSGTPNSITKSSDLNECIDCFMIPHSDPLDSVHASVYRYLQPLSEGGYGGWVWAGCHGAGDLEVMNPEIPTRFATYVASGTSNWDFASTIGDYTDRIGAVRNNASNGINLQFHQTSERFHEFYYPHLYHLQVRQYRSLHNKASLLH